MLSTLENPEVVDEYLHKELLEGRIADITDKAGLLPIQISPLGVIPKKHSLESGVLLYIYPARRISA